ncbi:MAG: serine/threonine-protein kinase [Deltaproteobacteria bacterium]|nr:serine/threonine-protein kinase [Deltaproteobacteria bacterium]
MAIDAPAPAWPEPLGGLLGAGGFAAVWSLGDDRVVKVAHASHDLSRARLAREADALAAIGPPAVPQLHDRGVLPDGRAFIVMERVTGVSVADITTAPVRIADSISIAAELLTSLEHVHAAHFVHRDLKPDNLVRTPAGRVVILDLGLARKLPTDPDDPTRANVQVGSLEYMPPEQLADSSSVDERSDLYAFGCILFELISGRPPFVGDAALLERAHAALRPPRLGALAQVPHAVEQLVHDCLAKDPARRPSSAAEARARLLAAHDEPAATQTHSMSVIREGKQPVVLLWAELPKVDRALLATLAGRRLVIASQRGRRVLAGILGADHADPAAVAIAAARDLAAAGARVALHLEMLRVDSAGGASTLTGEPVDKPETWLPTTPWTGVVLTRALAAVTRAATEATSAGADWVALGAESTAAELFGRDAQLSDLVADAAVVLAPRTVGPAFALLVGEPGVGKTTFAAELARRLTELDARVHLGQVPAPGTGRPAYTALGDLVPPPTGPLVRAIGDALRAAARARPTAIILDDLQQADHELLDALEYATLGGEPLPLWILGITGPRLLTRRPQLGERAERRRRDELPPLDEDAAVALAASLLRPAEYPPLRALRRLASLAHGNPLHLSALVREIHDKGAIRARPGGTHYLDTTALDELSPAALGPWLAARELAGLGVELVALARLCAVLGGEVRRDDLVAIVEAVERGGGATTTIDVDIGLAELVRANILTASAHGFEFSSPLVEEGIYATTDEQERLALHRAALEHWRSGADDPVLADRVAHHAEAVGDAATAARAFATLGQHAETEHRAFDADEAWSGVVRNTPDRNIERARALLGRARARSDSQRWLDALSDLREAASIAEAIGNRSLEVEILIEQSTVLDYCEDFEGSAELAETARNKLAGEADRARLVDLDFADARAHFRNGRFGDAAPLFRKARDEARALGRTESATVAGLLLGCTLSELRALDEAEQVFADVIAACERAGDRFHLGAAYGNRAWLWSARGLADRTVDDLRAVIAIARESGQAHLERVATHNLAEHRLWEGELHEALQLARRGYALQSRAGEGKTRADRLLLARVLAALDERAELTELLATFRGEDGLSDDEQTVLHVLHGIADRDEAEWQAGLAGLPALFVQLRVEVGHLAARHGKLTGDLRHEIVALARTDGLWARRLAEF